LNPESTLCYRMSSDPDHSVGYETRLMHTVSEAVVYYYQDRECRPSGRKEVKLRRIEAVVMSRRRRQNLQNRDRCLRPLGKAEFTEFKRYSDRRRRRNSCDQRGG
jgi:hypothetical protein